MPAAALPAPLTHDVARPPIWARPDPALVAAGIEGEFVVARVRAAAMLLLLIAPTYNLLSSGAAPLHVAGFTVTLGAAVASIAIWWLLRGGQWRPWVGFASSSFDVSMVSLALWSFLIVASPLVALNSTVTFEMYFLALVATSLRYDARICITVGALAIAEYAALWAYAALNYDLNDPSYVAAAGPYLPVDLWTRLIILAIATLLAVTFVRRAQRLLYLAAHDRLTGLYNRGHFDAALASAMDHATRDQQPLSLALLDVDHFKKINDDFGHAIGDRALREMAQLLARSMRRTDVVARYGGEEFVILMPNTTRDAALTRVETLRREVANTPITLPDGSPLNLGFSAGVAGRVADAEAVSPQSLMSIADRRLLAAKRAGRGRCFGHDA